MSEWTRPNVNYAKDWLNHSFLCPGLVWSQKEFHFECDHQGAVNNHFPVYWGLFRHGDEQPTYQPGDPSASLQCSVRRQSFAKPCPGLSERLFRPIIAQSFARFIIFTDDRTAKSSVNGLAVTLDRLIRLMRHLYIIWSGVDASILNYTEKNDNDEHCNHCIVSIIFLFGGKEEYIYDDDYLKKWPYTAHRAVVRSVSIY